MDLDHLAVAGKSLEAARAYVQEALGVAMQSGGRHDIFSTHNALLGLEDGLYLEAIARDPDAPAPTRPRWFDLDRFEGPPRLVNWICRTSDLSATLAALPAGLGPPVDLRRDALRWRMAVPEDGILPFDNRAPALIEWQAGGHPCEVLKASGVSLRRLTLLHPHAEALKRLLKVALEDQRVMIERGPNAIHAEFLTPHGTRTLSG
ncbi:MAG: VOC family protein [Pseudomonadota bacterium]